MLSAWERLRDVFSKKRKKQIMMFGLEGQGKSSIMHCFVDRMGALHNPPALPFSLYEALTYKDVNAIAWCGGWRTPASLQAFFFPIWRNTDVMWCCVDSTDRDKVVETGKELIKILGIFSDFPTIEGFPLAILATKQDLVSSCMSVSEVEEIMDLGPLKGTFNIRYFGVSGITGAGLADAFNWSAKASGKGKLHEKEALEKWLDVEDENDDEFLEAVFSCELKEWNHRTHLRIVWVCLKREGWKRGVKSIFSAIIGFTYDDNNRIWCCGTGATTFHVTRMHFWNHMVHFAIKSAGDGAADFKTFLLLNPQLSNEGLIHYYYTDDLILSSSEAQTTVFLPDKRPLPRVWGDSCEMHAIEEVNQMVRSLMESQTTGEEFLEWQHPICVPGLAMLE